jgi:glycosyltransferase involved in cell wall biosynthesis
MLLAPHPDRVKPPAREGIAVVGELGRSSGLGEGARLMRLGLASLGVPSWAINDGLNPRADDLPPMPRDRAADVPEGVPLLLHVNAAQLPGALLKLGRAAVRGRMVIGHWAWELPTTPPAWRAGAAFVHEAWVPSRFTRDAIEKLLPGRVRVVPYPLAISPPRPSRMDRQAFGLHEDQVVVLVAFNLASSLERKNPLAAIAAFRAAFGERADRLLLLKITNPGHFPEDFRRVAEVVAGSQNIRLESRTLPAADAHALTACVDVVLSLHRSEGFGLVPAEAMLLGKPVIATNWSGNTDFMSEDTAALVGYRLIPARDPRAVFEAEGAVWAEPDLGDAVTHLRRLAEDAAERVALGRRAARSVSASLGTQGLEAALKGIGLNRISLS